MSRGHEKETLGRINSSKDTIVSLQLVFMILLHNVILFYFILREGKTNPSNRIVKKVEIYRSHTRSEKSISASKER